ncbi:DUF72 domain-containing protein [Geobacter sp.]|uniref:DUF72 domain-containing protein n=1 Tax=Geobacter sp. TaxID=46610 RepID=UPI00262900D6|nr:DUF72 domain-containing protein [Geobacter sp.]
MSRRDRIHIGTSGWHYDHWKGPFYPEGVRPEEMLAYYAGHFQAAEINNSFYHLPSVEALDSWRKAVPEEFIFAVKASRYITHMKKLKDAGEAVEHFLGRVNRLGKQLGPVLFQLPPRWRCNAARLGEFLARLPEGFRYAFEFRDPSWFADEVYALLRQRGAAFCIYELAGTLSPREITADFVYLRLHGPGGAYQGSYDTTTLAGWAGALSAWAREGKEVFCFFDNDQNGYAALNARSLQEMVGKGE